MEGVGRSGRNRWDDILYTWGMVISCLSKMHLQAEVVQPNNAGRVFTPATVARKLEEITLGSLNAGPIRFSTSACMIYVIPMAQHHGQL